MRPGANKERTESSASNNHAVSNTESREINCDDAFTILKNARVRKSLNSSPGAGKAYMASALGISIKDDDVSKYDTYANLDKLNCPYFVRGDGHVLIFPQLRETITRDNKIS